MRASSNIAAAASLAVLTAIAAIAGAAPASAHLVSSSMHVVPLPSSHYGSVISNVNNESNIVRGFPKGPAMIQSPDHNKGRYGYWSGNFGYGGVDMVSSDDTCFEYRRTYDRWGHYLGRQPINVCQ
jgi:hypothetical protein